MSGVDETSKPWTGVEETQLLLGAFGICLVDH